LDVKLRVARKPVTVRFSEATVHTAGEQAGSIDLVVQVWPATAQTAVVDRLRLKVPGHAALLAPHAIDPRPDGLHLAFGAPWCAGARLIPFQVELRARSSGVRLAKVDCRRA
jgi:hypothetical protein